MSRITLIVSVLGVLLWSPVGGVHLLLPAIVTYEIQGEIPREQPTQSDGTPEHHPRCLSGAAIPLPSSRAEDTLSDKFALELMHGQEGMLVSCTIDLSESPWPEQRPYFAIIKQRQELPEQGRQTYIIEYQLVFASLIPNYDNSPETLIVVTEERCYACICHGCPAKIWGGLFERRGQEWHSIFAPQQIAEFGQWNYIDPSPENSRLVQIGPSKYGVMIKNPFTGFGTTTQAAILIGVADGKLKQLLPFGAVLAEDNSGGCGIGIEYQRCYSFDSTVLFRKRADLDYFDLVLDTRGTGYGGKDISRKRLFTFRDGNYIQVW